MKCTTLITSLLAPAAALALPSFTSLPGVSTLAAIARRQSGSIIALTDSYSFSLTLPQFTAKRDARDPPTLDWSTDGCTSSPDNPLGFPFLPACHRHDFGYHNFRAQSRFTESNKLRIDNKFRDDLKFQCQSVSSLLRGICNALADVYYAAVRAFGGDDATPDKRDDELVRIYEEKLAIYNALVENAKSEGVIEA